MFTVTGSDHSQITCLFAWSRCDKVFPADVSPTEKSRMLRSLDNASCGRCFPWTTRPLVIMSLGELRLLEVASLTDVSLPWTATRYFSWQASLGEVSRPMPHSKGRDTSAGRLHCNENPIHVFPEKELRGLSPNIHIRVSVSDLYIPRIGQRIFLPLNRQTDRGKTLLDRGVLTEQLLTAIWRICFSCGHFLPTPLFSLVLQSTLFTERPTSTSSVQQVDRVPCQV